MVNVIVIVHTTTILTVIVSIRISRRHSSTNTRRSSGAVDQRLQDGVRLELEVVAPEKRGSARQGCRGVGSAAAVVNVVCVAGVVVARFQGFAPAVSVCKYLE